MVLLWEKIESDDYVLERQKNSGMTSRFFAYDKQVPVRVSVLDHGARLPF